MTKHQIDCSGLKCPMPIVEVFKSFSSMEVGDTLTIKSDDIAFSHDIEAWCTRMEQPLISLENENGLITAEIKKVK